MVLEEVAGLYRIISLKVLRRTPNVCFDALDLSQISPIASIDRVMHGPGAISPGGVGDVARPWYMHPHQEDNLMVLHGARYVELFTSEHGRVETFAVRPDSVSRTGGKTFEGAVMLVWPRRVFHRIVSCPKEGSASINLAAHFEGFDIRTNFNVYDLDTSSGEYRVVREGHLDQPGA
jgi:hypothetical protein